MIVLQHQVRPRRLANLGRRVPAAQELHPDSFNRRLRQGPKQKRYDNHGVLHSSTSIVSMLVLLAGGF